MNLDLHMARPEERVERVVMRMFSGLCGGGYGRGVVMGEFRGVKRVLRGCVGIMKALRVCIEIMSIKRVC